jgi:hypothetical protein
MKKLTIAGAMLGFSTGVILGRIQGSLWPDVLWRAVIACCIASYLFRWWGRMWLKALRQAHAEQLANSQV